LAKLVELRIRSNAPSALSTAPNRTISRFPAIDNSIPWAIFGPAIASQTVPAVMPSTGPGPATPVL